VAAIWALGGGGGSRGGVSLARCNGGCGIHNGGLGSFNSGLVTDVLGSGDDDSPGDGGGGDRLARCGGLGLG
jgi:hypothetical protein